MKIRFSKNDVLDTKNIEGEGADISELETAVSGITESVNTLSGMFIPESLQESDIAAINAGMTSLYAIFPYGTFEVDNDGFVKLQSNG